MAHILVVDDEPDVRELFNITLKMAGHQTDTAKDGLEAVDKLGQKPPDLILLDLMMPRMDGFAFLSHVREKNGASPMRVLVATAKVLEEADRQKLSAWPVVGVLNKGDLDIGGMVGVISSALNKNPSRPNGQPKPPDNGKAEAPAPGGQPEPPAPDKPEPPKASPPEAKPSNGKGAGSQPSSPQKPGGWLSTKRFW